MNKQNKKDEKRHYTVSDKVLAARRLLGKKRRGTCKDWVTCKVDRDNVIWARHTHGSVNAALEKEKHKMIGRESALAAPPRNCDVGTAEEQEARFNKFCSSYYNINNVDGECNACPLNDNVKTTCEFAWMQMPYEEGGAK